MDFKSPHKLRNGHGVFGVKAAKTVEDFKAFSLNMMHESMEITDRLYGQLSNDDIEKAISRLGKEDLLEIEDEKLYLEFLAFRKWRRSQEE